MTLSDFVSLFSQNFTPANPVSTSVLTIAFVGLCCFVQCSPTAPNESPNSGHESGIKPLKSYLDTITQPIDGIKAMAIAEAWIVEQGYTDKVYPPNQPHPPIQFEKGEFATDSSKILKLRHNTLKAESVGAREYGEQGGKWLIGFRYTHLENNIVRAVTMDSLARTIVMQTQDVREDWVLGRE